MLEASDSLRRSTNTISFNDGDNNALDRSALSCTAVIECIDPNAMIEATMTSLTASGTEVTASNELRLTLSGVPVPRRKRVLILMVDMSGSMRPAFAQVQAALVYIVGRSFEHENVAVEVVLYNRHSARIPCTRDNYYAQLMDRRANGGTCFASAFETTYLVAKQYIDADDATGNTDIAIGFMTDGRHTSQRRPLEAYQRLRELLHSARGSTVVHCIGFTPNHRFEELNRIRSELGKVPGSFQYAELEDGPTALQAKMEALYEFVANYGVQLALQVRMPGFVVARSPTSVLSSSASDTCSFDATSDKHGVITHTLYVSSFDPEAYRRPGLYLELEIANELFGAPTTLDVFPEITDVLGAAAQHLVLLQALEVELTSLFQLITAHSDDNLPNDAQLATYRDGLSRVQHALKDTATLFRLPKRHRSALMERNAAVHQRLDELLELVANYARGAWSNANKARLADIRFGATYGFKANRKRRLDARVAANAERLREDAERLRQLELDATTAAALESVSANSRDLFACTLSIVDWVEIVHDKDVCGFGLAVSRPEWVVDDPTGIRVLSISSTFISKSAFEDAIAMSIDIRGHLGTTGGFGVGHELGVAMRGRGREPINAWLPLYIHAAHWAAASIQLRQILGYYTTLDPLGFHVNQIDALFSVLGTMVSRLQHPVGEHDLLHLFQYLRTCVQVAREFNCLPLFEQRLRQFTDNCHYNVAEQAKHLVTLAAYVLVLPRDALHRVFPDHASWLKFWVALTAVAVRRSAFAIFAHSQPDNVLGYVDRLLYGLQYDRPAGGGAGGDEPHDGVAYFEPVLSPDEQHQLLHGADAQPPPEAIVSGIDWRNDDTDQDQGDRKPAAAATAPGKHCNYYRPPLKEETTDTATATATAAGGAGAGGATQQKGPELREGDDIFSDFHFAVPSESDSDADAPVLPSGYDASRVSPSMIDAMSRFCGQMGRRGYPTLQALRSLLLFTHHWHRVMPDTTDELCAKIDSNGGLAPREWIDAIKAAFTELPVRQAAAPRSADNVDTTRTMSCHVVDVLELLAQTVPESELLRAPHTNLVRAIICQGVMYRTNNAAREAVASELYMDSLADPDRCLLAVHAQLHQMRYDNMVVLWRANRFARAVRGTLLTLDMGQFANDLRTHLQGTRYTNHTRFPVFLRQFQSSGALRIPNLTQKLKLIFSGKYVTYLDATLRVEKILDNGAVWIPGRRHRFLFFRVIGPLIEQIIHSVLVESTILRLHEQEQQQQQQQE